MKLLAAFVMRGRVQAIVVTTVAALLSLLLPPLSYVSGAAVGLVALRIGPGQGMVVIAGAVLAVAALGTITLGAPWVAGVFLLALWLPVGVLAARLRRTVDLARTLRLAAGFGGAAVIAVYATVQDPAAWWAELLQQIFAAGTGQSPLGEEALADVAALMTGMAAAALTLGIMGALLLARWWQAILYNPGGFRSEFHQLRLGRGVTVAAMALLAMASLPIGVPAHFAAELAVVMMMLFVIQGLAVAHGLVTATGASSGWLIALYLLLLFMLPQTAVTLAVVGIVDNWFDFRQHFGSQKKD